MKNLVLALVLLLFAANSFALTIDNGVKILAVDGNDDSNVTVALSNLDISDGYYLLYSVNGNAWTHVNGAAAGLDTDWFVGGDVLDFALSNSYYQQNATMFYTLSGDIDNDAYSVLMDFYLPVDAVEAQQPIMTSDYYKGVGITWTFGDDYTFSNTFSMNYANNDGVAPVPEPATLVLLGTGLVGLAFMKRRKK